MEGSGPCQFPLVTSCEHFLGTKCVQLPGGSTKETEVGRQNNYMQNLFKDKQYLLSD